VARDRFESLEAERAAEPAIRLPHEDLVRIWSGLQDAARTDSSARQFVDYFSADAARLFGAGSPQR
jgi:hypothetical protein